MITFLTVTCFHITKTYRQSMQHSREPIEIRMVSVSVVLRPRDTY